MSSVIYAIVFKGEVIEGFKPISVKAHMAKLLKADVDKMKMLFSGKQIVIKRTADKQEAVKYGGALKKIGADVKVRVIKSDAPQKEPAQKAPQPEQKAPQPEQKAPQPEQKDPAPQSAKPPAAVDTSGISLAPNEGYIVEPSTPPPPPDVDISGISVAENDGTPLIEATEQERADIDLSEYSIRENDGSPLVEPSDEDAPVIEVPDFGLDEPGAILETLPDEREQLNPNTMGMTLATAGSDMLEPEDRDQTPAPKAPDTSAINLVPNFD
ncbi:MAG: hypothetical protein IIB71_02360 [Proteobacteria bacterium]|nr:hypothetical protein [Pseudomonadota bacterium]